MAIGSLGSLITFETSDSRILTFMDLQREDSARWTTHYLIGKRPVKEFVGPDLQKVTFTITLDACHGVKPRKTMRSIRNALKKGKAYYLVIGSSSISANKMVITGVSESWDRIYNKGELVRSKVDLTLEEYL